MSQVRIGIELPGPGGETFRVAEFLGQGAFGEVYRVTGVTSGLTAAVKLLPVNELEDSSARTALLNEVAQGVQVRHPNVVQILHVDRGSVPEIGPYVVMEFVTGGTLEGLLRTQRAASQQIPMKRALEMVVDIAKGAKAVNEHIIHRDLKPDNILIGDGRLMIGDFGISKIVDERTRTHTFKGGQHIAYMAPEGWENRPNTVKLDVYSVGLVFYEILTLMHPIEQQVSDRADWQAWRKAHMYGSIPDPRDIRSEIPRHLSQLLQRMVAKRAGDRPEWDEVLSIVTSTEGVPASAKGSPKVSTIETIVDAADRLRRGQEQAELTAREAAERRNRTREAYEYVCEELASSFDRLVEEFNSKYQFGQIRVQKSGNGNRLYTLLGAGAIECECFPHYGPPMKINWGELIGWGYLGIVDGASANLLLVRTLADDIYGKWLGCLIRVGAFVANPAAIAQRYGLKVWPFGFRQAKHFYREIQMANAMHIFTYEIRDDVPGLFADLMETVFQRPASPPSQTTFR